MESTFYSGRTCRVLPLGDPLNPSVARQEGDIVATVTGDDGTGKLQTWRYVWLGRLKGWKESETGTLVSAHWFKPLSLRAQRLEQA